MARTIDADTLRAEFTGNFNGGYYTVPEIRATIDTAPTVGGWINVKDRLPEKPGQYPCVTLINGERHVQIELWHNNAWYWVPKVLYWLELPEIPEEEKVNG